MTAAAATVALRVRRRWVLISALTALAAGISLGVVIAVRGNAALGIDVEWMEEMVEHRSPFWEVPAVFMNFFGGSLSSTVLSVVVVVVLLVRKRRYTALFFAISALASTGLVQLLKAVLSRSRPEDILVMTDPGSFPSGHVANAATLAVALVIIAWRWWVWIAGAAYVLLMAVSRTYLGAHWATDTIGGLLVGGAVVVIVWAPLADRVLFERRRHEVPSES